MASRPLLLSLLVGFIGLLYMRVQQTHPEHSVQFAWVAFLSVGGYFLAQKLIPIVKVMCVEKGNLYGYDINKNGKEKVCACCLPLSIFQVSLFAHTTTRHFHEEGILDIDKRYFATSSACSN
jgi:hypothetical protein